MSAQTFSIDAALEIGSNGVVVNSTVVSLSSVLNMNVTNLSFGNTSSNVTINWANNPSIILANSTSNVEILSNGVWLNGFNCSSAKRVKIFAANGTFVPNTQTKLWKITLVGGGGGGGATGNASATTLSLSTGGSSAATLVIYANNITSNQDVIVGLGGNGASTANSVGWNGGVSSFGGGIDNNGGIATGGVGGHGGSVIGASTANGVLFNTDTDLADHFSVYDQAKCQYYYGLKRDQGSPSVRLSGTVGWAGGGGETPLFKGSSHGGRSGIGGATNATLPGGGGSGAVSTNTSFANGGNGANGIVIIEEFFGL